MKTFPVKVVALSILLIIGMQNLYLWTSSYLEGHKAKHWLHSCSSKKEALADLGAQKIVAFRKACGGMDVPRRIEVRVVKGFFDPGEPVFIFEPYYTYDGINLSTPQLTVSAEGPTKIKISIDRVWLIDRQMDNVDNVSIDYGQTQQVGLEK